MSFSLGYRKFAVASWRLAWHQVSLRGQCMSGKHWEEVQGPLQLLHDGVFVFSSKELVRRGSFAFKEEAWLASRNARVSGKACEPCAEKKGEF